MALDGVFSNCSKLFPCPVCRATDRCSVIKARGIVNCRNEEANEGEPRIAKDGSHHWTHHTGRAGAALLLSVPDGPPVAEPGDLNTVYRMLLGLVSRYGLSPRHRQNLHARGLDDPAIEKGAYWTVPNPELGRQIAAQLVTLLSEEVCRQVPGFIKDDEGWHLMTAAGMFVPVRDSQDRIVSLKIRLDEPLADGSRYLTFSSASKGGPTACRAVHFPWARWAKRERVRITEGEMKADVTNQRSGMYTLSLPGVGAWRSAVPAVRAFDSAVKTVVIAFDADRDQKRAVAMCQAELVGSLREAKYNVEIEHWPMSQGKGIDDLLLGGHEPAVLTGEDVDLHVKACLKAVGYKTVREELEEIVAAIAAAGAVLPVYENREWLTLLAEVHAESKLEFEWFRHQVNKAGLKGWTMAFIGCLKAHLAERRLDESEALVKNEDAGGLPTIETYDRNVREIAPEAIEALGQANEPPKLFQQGGHLAHLGTVEKQVQTVEVGHREMLMYLNKSANWTYSKGKRPEFINCPDAVAQHLLADKLLYGPFPELRGIVETPCFDKEGNLICQPGFHPPSGLYYQPKEVLAIDFQPDRLPTEDDFRRAKGWIEQHMFKTIPFAHAGGHAFAWALFLLPFVREMIDGPTPLHIINAPKEGTGKGLLNFACTQAFVRGGAAPKSQIRSNEEWGKSMLSFLREGTSHLYFDNVAIELDSDVLALCLTERSYSRRPLGTNSVWTVPIRQTWSLSGNNVQVSNEINRRSLWCDLDANCEDPSQRQFAVDLRIFLTNNRPSAVANALTCIRWWLANDCPLRSGKAPGSFERWAAVIGGILACCEVEGFLEGQRLGDEQSEDQMGWRCFVSEWWQRYGDQPVKARDLMEIAQTLPFWAAVEGSRSPAQSFGMHLQKKKNAVFLGKKVVSQVVSHQSVYHLAVVSEADHRQDMAERKAA